LRRCSSKASRKCIPCIDGLKSSFASGGWHGLRPCSRVNPLPQDSGGQYHWLAFIGVMDNEPVLVWASHFLCDMAKALMDDAHMGMRKNR